MKLYIVYNCSLERTVLHEYSYIYFVLVWFACAGFLTQRNKIDSGIRLEATVVEPGKLRARSWGRHEPRWHKLCCAASVTLMLFGHSETGAGFIWKRYYQGSQWWETLGPGCLLPYVLLASWVSVWFCFLTLEQSFLAAPLLQSFSTWMWDSISMPMPCGQI